MQCREFEDRMNDVLDQRRAPEKDDLLRSHAGGCISCRQLLEGQAVLLGGVELLEVPAVSSRFAARVLEQAAPVSPAADVVPRKMSKWLMIAAGIASLAAVVLVAVLIDLSGQPGAGPNTALKPAIEPTPKKVDGDAAPKNALEPAIANVAPKNLPSEFPAPVERDYREIRDAFTSLTDQFPTAVEKLDEVQQATPAMRPLRASFSMAIGTLQRTIPNTRRPPQPPKPDSGYFGGHRDGLV